MPAGDVPEDRARRIHDYWFGASANRLQVIEDNYRRWFEQGRELDAEIREQFSGDLAAARRGELDGWGDRVVGAMALVLLLDQFPRHIHRGTAAAFASDARALEVCLAGIERGIDTLMSPVQQAFFYLPLQHAEDIAMQDRSVELLERRTREAPPEFRDYLNNTLGYARQHREVIVRFGRYPHRNAVLGRVPTPEEQHYLAAGASRYGQ